MKSINNLTISGRIASVTIDNAKTYAKFSIAHNFGGGKTIFPDFTMFAKVAGRTRKLPEDLLKKGTAVTVSAYLYPGADKSINFIVKKVEPCTDEVADEPQGEEEAPAE